MGKGFNFSDKSLLTPIMACLIPDDIGLSVIVSPKLPRFWRRYCKATIKYHCLQIELFCISLKMFQFKVVNLGKLDYRVGRSTVRKLSGSGAGWLDACPLQRLRPVGQRRVRSRCTQSDRCVDGNDSLRHRVSQWRGRSGARIAGPYGSGNCTDVGAAAHGQAGCQGAARMER